MRNQFFYPFWVVLAGLPCLLSACNRPHAPATTRPAGPEVRLPDDFGALGRRFGVTLRMYDPDREPQESKPGACVYEPPTVEDVTQQASLVREELNRYAPEVIRRLWLSEIILCGSITSDGHRLNGITRSRILGTIHFSLRVDARQPMFSAGWARHAFHHELFHRLDACQGERFHAEWDQLNPRGFSYGQPARDVIIANPPLGGFLFADSTSSRSEDQAHFFGAMVTQYAAVRDLAARDPIVRAKADLMERIAASFNHRLGPGFWAEAQRRSESPARRKLAALWYQWDTVRAGVDPLAPGADVSVSCVIVRPTQFPDAAGYRRDTGRLTQLNVSRERLISRLYNVPATRCLMPAEMKDIRYDIIVNSPSAAPLSEEDIWTAVQRSFEAQFHLVMRRETRPVDVYVMRMRPDTLPRLEALAADALRRPSREMPSTQPFPPGGTSRRQGNEWMMSRSGPGFFGFGRSGTLDEIASRLEYGPLDRPLINETGFQKVISPDFRWDWNKPGSIIPRLIDALGVGISVEPRSLEVVVLNPS